MRVRIHFCHIKELKKIVSFEYFYLIIFEKKNKHF